MAGDVRCFYLDGQTCLETDFDLSLTRQQPTFWDAREGRRVNPKDNQAGLDPGLVPPLPPNFAGALVCVEVDTSDAPAVRNQLKGEATIIDRSQSFSQNSVSKYNAVAVQGLAGPSAANLMNNKLQLDGIEYSACPAALGVDFNRRGEDTVIKAIGNGGRCLGGVTPGAGCNNSSQCPGSVAPPVAPGVCSTSSGKSNAFTRVTVVPCNLDFSNVTRANVTLSLGRVDETEISLSGAVPQFGCWASFVIDDAFGGTVLATDYGTAGMRPVAGGPVVGVAETFVADSLANTASAAVNLHTRGVCSLNPGLVFCNRDGDCPTGSGTCQFTQIVVGPTPVPVAIRLPAP
jgi:hypothetical protein